MRLTFFNHFSRENKVRIYTDAGEFASFPAVIDVHRHMHAYIALMRASVILCGYYKSPRRMYARLVPMMMRMASKLRHSSFTVDLR